MSEQKMTRLDAKYGPWCPGSADDLEIKLDDGLIYEAGGGATNTGSARIVAEADGSPPVAEKIRTRGHLSNEAHAGIKPCKGQYLLVGKRADNQPEDEEWGLFVCEKVGCGIAHFRFVEGELPEKLSGAAQALNEKMECYHCREAHFVADERSGR